MLDDAPITMTAPETAYTVFYILFGVNVVVTAGWLWWEQRRTRSSEVLLAVAGGIVVGYFVPPLYNFLTKVWFPSNIPLPVIDAFGMKDPVFDLIGYASFIGVGGYLFMLQLRNGSRHAVLKTVAFWAVTDLLLELPFLAADMYTYYGNQAFTIGGFPLHWIVINGTIPVISGAIMFAVTDKWPAGFQIPTWVRVTATPTAAAAVMMVPIFPIALSLHSGAGMLMCSVASALGIAVCAGLLLLVVLFNDVAQPLETAEPSRAA